jgi:hypothetical protein
MMISRSVANSSRLSIRLPFTTTDLAAGELATCGGPSIGFPPEVAVI